MNSLLQTLFMTQELRKRLYLWQFEEKPGLGQEESIPYQLQELFGRLQLTQRSAVDTKGLIRSFRWDSMETFIQNDVQEFCRVLFDAIERSAPSSSLISSLFQGLLLDYVHCQSCHRESHREDQFLDLSLAIRSHSDQTTYDSLEKALEAFIRPETLTGSNQYYCSVCDRKTDAIKGLRFRAFPQIVMIQLKRFDLDMETMRRRKLEDYVEFPLEIDLGKYVVGKWRSRRGKEGGMEGKERARMAYVINPLFRPLHPGSDHSSLSPASLPPSPSLYSLYSVLVHSGSVAGGHYYAYIKSFEDSHWYRFNDSQVTKASEADLKSTYGGKDGTAYLLVYELKGEEGGRVEDWEVPEAVRRVVEEEKRKGKEVRREALARARLVTVRFYYKGQEKTLEMPCTQSVSSLLPSVQAQFHIAAEIRLRKYQSFHGTATDVLKDTDTLEGVGLGYGALLVEEKGENGVFVEFKKGDFQLKVAPWTEETCNSPLLTYSEKTSSPLLFPTNLSTLWASVLSQLHLSLYPASPSILVQCRTYTGLNLALLSDRPDLATVTVGELHISESWVLLVEPWEPTIDQKLSKWALEIQMDTYRAEIRFNAIGEGEGRNLRELRLRVLLDLRKSIGDLKLAVAETIQKDASSFIMRKGLSRLGGELKDLSLSLGQAGLSLTAAVYIESGLPLPVDHVRVYVSLIAPPSGRLGSTAVTSIWEICQLAVHWTTPISTMKDMVVSASRKYYPTLLLPESRLFLRNLAQNRPGAVLLATDSIATGPLESEKAIGMHVVEEEAGEWRPNMTIIGVKMWREEEGLGQIRYFAVEKAWNLLELGDFLSNLHSIPLSSLILQVVASPALFQLTDLLTEPWLCPHTAPLGPISLGQDSLLIVRDKKQAIKFDFTALARPERPLVIRLKGEK